VTTASTTAWSTDVLKIGGSVLTGLDAYRRAAGFVARRLAEHRGVKLVVVVSAEHGQTDVLLQTARDLSPTPDREALDLLWSTGELRSVALLVLALQARGVRATSANVHQTGIGEPDTRGPAGAVSIQPLRLRSRLAGHDVVVVPGFLARGAGDTVVSLGRGGSDLTAVLLAAGLGARGCELVKDVDGYYSSDPNLDARARHLPAIDFDRALAMADAGCCLVQRAALETARAHNLTLTVRAVDSRRSTRVGSDSGSGYALAREPEGSRAH
jgi:aspartate kinase